MRFLLDTHTLLWSFNASPLLSRQANRHIRDEHNEILVSAASAWEIATKVRLGKLPSAEVLLADFGHYLAQLRFHSLSISIEHAARAGSLAGEHRGPFDRMLIAQAQIENLKIINNDRVFDAYGVERIW